MRYQRAEKILMYTAALKAMLAVYSRATVVGLLEVNPGRVKQQEAITMNRKDFEVSYFHPYGTFASFVQARQTS